MNGSFDDLYLSFNTLCAYAVAGCFLVAPALLVIFICRNQDRLLTRSNEAFNQCWSMFLSSFSSSLLAGPVFYFFFYIRRFVMVITIFTIPPRFFALFNFSLSTTVLPAQVFIYVLTQQPFTDWIDNVQNVVAEAGTMVVSVLVSAYTFDLSEEAKEAFDVECGQ